MKATTTIRNADGSVEVASWLDADGNPVARRHAARVEVTHYDADGRAVGSTYAMVSTSLPPGRLERFIGDGADLIWHT